MVVKEHVAGEKCLQGFRDRHLEFKIRQPEYSQIVLQIFSKLQNQFAKLRN